MSTCKCGHEMTDHGNADGQTGWQAPCYGTDEATCDCENYDLVHDFTTCDCSECHRALLDLQDELDELERTDPDVRAAAESYDAMVRRMTAAARRASRADDGDTTGRA